MNKSTHLLNKGVNILTNVTFSNSNKWFLAMFKSLAFLKVLSRMVWNEAHPRVVQCVSCAKVMSPYLTQIQLLVLLRALWHASYDHLGSKDVVWFEKYLIMNFLKMDNHSLKMNKVIQAFFCIAMHDFGINFLM